MPLEYAHTASCTLACTLASVACNVVAAICYVHTLVLLQCCLCRSTCRIKGKIAKFHPGKVLGNVRVWLLCGCAFVSDLVLLFGVCLNIILTSSRFLVLLPLLMLTCVYNYYRTAPDRQTKHHAGCLCIALLTVLLVTQTFTGPLPLFCLCCACCAVFLVSARHSVSCVCSSLTFLPTYLAICTLLVLSFYAHIKTTSWGPGWENLIMVVKDRIYIGTSISTYLPTYVCTHSSEQKDMCDIRREVRRFFLTCNM